MPESEVQFVYVLQGQDAFLREEARRKIVSLALGPSDPQLSLRFFDADAEGAEVLDELRTVPFLAPRRVVIVRDAEAFVSACRESLERYFDAPAQTAVLILEVGSWPNNTRLAKKLPAVGERIDCTSPEGPKLLAWIRSAAKARGKEMDAPATEQLAEQIGPNLTLLSSELDKLAAYVGDRTTITAPDVSAVVAAAAGTDTFAVANALTLGDTVAALRAVAEALRTRGAEFTLLGQIAWHLRRAMQVSQDLAAGRDPQAALKAARVFYSQQEFLSLLRRRRLPQLQADFRRLLAADLGMKSGREPAPVLQQLVVDLCR